jgi:hypothetical protein
MIFIFVYNIIAHKLGKFFILYSRTYQQVRYVSKLRNNYYLFLQVYLLN